MILAIRVDVLDAMGVVDEARSVRNGFWDVLNTRSRGARS
jgi:hypothetical protein